jgi:hypothetical protein
MIGENATADANHLARTDPRVMPRQLRGDSIVSARPNSQPFSEHPNRFSEATLQAAHTVLIAPSAWSKWWVRTHASPCVAEHTPHPVARLVGVSLV